MTDPTAPHGRDDNGTPLAPYGLKTDGTPRLSRRGAVAGAKGNTAPGRRRSGPGPSATVSSLTDVQRKGMLIDLADMILSPLATAAEAPFIRKRIGAKQSSAVLGDVFIMNQFLPGFADGLIFMSKTKPATLAWMDKAEENAPMLILASVGLQAVKALIENHIRPNPTFAQAGKAMATAKLQQLADAVNAAAGQAVPAEPTIDFERAAYDRTMAEAA